MKKFFYIYLLAAGFLISSPLPRIEDLPPKYRAWLNEEVVYIITAKEKDVFLKLASDKERDIFIEAFWSQRDPIPETPQNEFEVEHYDRIRYANEKFGKGTSKPGWKTDRGRVHIILGKPRSSNSYGGESLNLVPIDLWFYQGEYGHGLPQAFYVLFFQEDGIGDYILYSPIRHGAKKLIESYDGDPSQAVNVLLRVDRELANVSMSLIPGEQNAYRGMPEMRSETLLASIQTYPQKRINDVYAEKLLKYKSIVEVDRSVNYVANDALLKVVAEKDGRRFVHYAVEPNRLSIGRVGDRYAVHLEVFGRVADPSDRTVYQFQKDVSLDFGADEVAEMKSKRLSFQDAFPLIEGHFKFNVLIKNPISKEFTSYEDEIVVPPSAEAPGLGPVFLSRALDPGDSPDGDFRPFRLGHLQIQPVASRIFDQDAPLVISVGLPPMSPESRAAATLDLSFFKEDQKVRFVSRPLRDLKDPACFSEELAPKDFEPGIYRVVATLLDADGKELGAAREDFIVNDGRVPRPLWRLAQALPPLDDPGYSHILGTQLLNSGRPGEAKILLEEACRKDPASLEFSLGLSQALFRLQAYPAVQDVLVRFLSRAAERPEIYELLGKSAYFQKGFGSAVYYFKKYLSRFGAKIEILNLLGESYYGSGDLESARSAWKKSIEIEPEQPEIVKKLDGLR